MFLQNFAEFSTVLAGDKSTNMPYLGRFQAAIDKLTGWGLPRGAGSASGVNRTGIVRRKTHPCRVINYYMQKICRGEPRNLANWPAEFGKICRGKLWSLLLGPGHQILPISTKCYLQLSFKYWLYALVIITKSLTAPENARERPPGDEHKHCTMQPFDTAFGGGGHGARLKCWATALIPPRT